MTNIEVVLSSSRVGVYSKKCVFNLYTLIVKILYCSTPTFLQLLLLLFVAVDTIQLQCTTFHEV